MNYLMKTKIFSLLFFMLVVLSGCSSESVKELLESNTTVTVVDVNNSDGNTTTFVTLTKETVEPVGENCESGGKLIEHGIDANDDGILDPSEVTNAVYVCSEPNVNIVIDCNAEVPDSVCGEDNDSDGLVYATEVLGWEVWPDRSGLGNGVEESSRYTVTSNPNVVDTDGDGLSDYQEFLAKTDPRMKDTDGDGLSDEEEINRWGTSPVSIDTDADSRGANKDKSPNIALFDGAELKIDFNDSTHTPGFGATSPLHSDTDGDGWDDYDEIVEKLGSGFNPTLADVPKTTIEIAGSPVIRLTGSSSSETNWVREVAVSDSISDSVSSESSVTRGTEQVIEATVGAGIELGVSTGLEIGTDTKWTGSVSASFSTNFSVSKSMASSQSVAWTQGQSRTAEQTYQESMGEGGSDAVTLDGGYISLPINLVNTGDISFTMTGLRLNVLARYINGTSDYTPVLELKRVDDLPLTLGPGEKQENMLLQSTTQDYELIRSFLKHPSGLLFEVSSYTMSDAGGVPYGFAEETIKQKTATVIIDYGGELAPERYLVATTPKRLASLDGVRMATVMADILNVPYEVAAESSGFFSLSGVRDVLNDSVLYKKWLVTTTSASQFDNDLTGFDDIVLQAGDTIYFMYVKDQDADGLSAREEFLNGTSDMTPDSDNDGLSDFEEVRAGWPVKIEGQLAYDVRSYGFDMDSDADDLNDTFERNCGLDPTRADTDRDGISDYDEMYGYDINGTLNFRVVPYAGVVILDGGNGVIDTTPTGDDINVSTSIKKGDIIITAGDNGVIDTTPLGDDYLGVNHVALECQASGYATNPLNSDTDGESVLDGKEREIALGSPNNSNDVAVYVDSDGDGLSDATELDGYTSSVNGVSTYFISDINSSDSDGDGLPDLLEYILKSNPKSSDTDGDGITDLDEYDFVFKWNEFETACSAKVGCNIPSTQGAKYGTNLNLNDSDNDGLNDSLEINGWLVSVDGGEPTSVTTNPLLNEDKDYDGLYDYHEWYYKTNPTIWDTDGDGTSDGAELSIYANIGGHRSPIQKDRKITLTYKKFSISGQSDFSWFWWDWNNEFDWMFKVKTSQYTGKYLLSSSNGTTNPNSVSYKTINMKSKAFSQVINVSKSFILRYGATFDFYGYVRELDNEVGTRNMNLTDSGVMYRDANCPDCKSLIVKSNRRDIYITQVANPSSLRFTVNRTLVTREFSFSGTFNGWWTDVPGLQNMGVSTCTWIVRIDVN